MIKKICVGLVLVAGLYLSTLDDPRIEVNKAYIVNGVSETYFSAISSDGRHHIAVELGEFGINDVEMGDEVKATILVDRILDVKEW